MLSVAAGSGNLPATGTSSTLPLTAIALGAIAAGAVVLGGSACGPVRLTKTSSRPVPAVPPGGAATA